MNRRLTYLTLASLLILSSLWTAGSPAVQAQRPQKRSGDRLLTPQQDGKNVVLEGQTGGTTSGVAVSGQYAYIGIGQRLAILDISDPAQPARVGQTDLLPGDVFDVAVVGDYAYVACFINGLRIIDISFYTMRLMMLSTLVS